jgi:hypothetical protein
MDAREAIIEAFYQLSTPRDGYKSIGEVVDLAAQLMGGKAGSKNYKKSLIEIRVTFEQSLSCREKTLGFSYSTHLARSWRFYRCGRRMWPGTKDYLKDGLRIGGKNQKVMRELSI